MNRNFLVRRGLTPREMLESSYRNIWSFCWESRSVWIAQREGRTKDGNDATNPGVLKMVGMASNGMDLMDYFKKSKSSQFQFPMNMILLTFENPQYWLRPITSVYIKEKMKIS
jgi:hypothetical protein